MRYRVNCPYMFMNKDFIQNKFIDGMHGQRFSFDNKIIMNIFNMSQIVSPTNTCQLIFIDRSYSTSGFINESQSKGGLWCKCSNHPMLQ